MYAERSQTRPSTTIDVGGAGAQEALRLPKIAIRGRSLLALVIAPEAPLDLWLAALDEQLGQAPDFFAGRPVVADLAAAPVPLQALDELARRDLKVVGAEGIDAGLLARTPWSGLPTTLRGRDAPLEARATLAPAPAAPAPRSVVIDGPVRSGQRVIVEDGDLTVMGAVASGADVIAGGSIHVYGPLRGRAIAGLLAGEAAGIFCRKLEAELVAVAGLYRTAEDWGAQLHGRPAQIRCERGRLRLTPLE